MFFSYFENFDSWVFGPTWMFLKLTFFEIGSLLFLIFGTMKQNSNAQNVTEPDFWKKIWGKFGLKNRVFWTSCKVASLVFFSDFWQKDSLQGTLKCGRNNFPGNFFSLSNTEFRFLGKFPFTIFLLPAFLTSIQAAHCIFLLSGNFYFIWLIVRARQVGLFSMWLVHVAIRCSSKEMWLV